MEAWIIPGLLFGALAVAFFLARALRRPMRRRALITWALAPFLAYAATTLWDLLAGASGNFGLTETAYPFALIAGFLGLPWLLACALGAWLGHRPG